MRLLGVISIAAIPLFVLVPGDDNNAEACGAKVSIKGAKLARMRKLQSSSERAPIAAGPIDIQARERVNVGGDSTQRGAVGHGGGEAGKAPGAKRHPKASKPIAQKEATPEPPKDEQPTSNPADMPRKTEEPAPKDETPPPAETDQPAKVKGKFASHYFFGNASSQLSAPNKGKLKQLVHWLKSNPDKSIVVEGHASTNGNLDANRSLSEKRANTVKEYLVELGADESRISVEAFGSDRPEFKPGSSAKNRRVIIVAK